jgi:hypothetical protein
MIQEFVGQNRDLIGGLLVGFCIPAGIVGMGMLAYWLNAQRVAAERNVPGALAESEVARPLSSHARRPVNPARPSGS